MSTTQQTPAPAEAKENTPASTAKAVTTAADQRRARAAAKTAGAKPAPAKPRPANVEPTQLAKDVKAAVDADKAKEPEKAPEESMPKVTVEEANQEVAAANAEAEERKAEEDGEKPAEEPKETSVARFKRLAQEKKEAEAAKEAEKAKPKEAAPKTAKAKVEKEALVQPVLPKGKRPPKGTVSKQLPIDGKNQETGFARSWHVHTVWLLEEEFMGTKKLHLSFDRRFGDCQFWWTNPETKKHEHMHTEYEVASDIEAIRKFGLKPEPHFKIRTSAKQ